MTKQSKSASTNSGGKGLYEVNKRVRNDFVLQIAFGRTSCAEQSTISETLNAATAENVSQMNESVCSIYRKYSRGFSHDYNNRFQLLDIDMSGMPCGKKSELASKGYFAKQKNKRGRQLGRVVAIRYREVVTSQLYDGKTKLKHAFQSPACAAEKILGLDSDKRNRGLSTKWVTGERLETERSRAVRRGAGGRLVTRWQPTLPPARFGEGPRYSSADLKAENTRLRDEAA